jgi:hypothetical protein
MTDKHGRQVEEQKRMTDKPRETERGAGRRTDKN